MKNERMKVAVEKFAESMIEKIEQVRANGGKWEKPWVGVVGQWPRNLSGRHYNGMNPLPLMWLMDKKGWQTGVFATMNQLNSIGCTVKSGEGSWPVVFWKFIFKDKEGNSIAEDEVKAMDEEQRQDVKRIPVLHYYPVWNIEQTDFPTVHSEKWAKLTEKSNAMTSENAISGMFADSALDSMIAYENWVCPIRLKLQDRAYYSPTSDEIVLPLKAQFKKGEEEKAMFESGYEFYGTMLHEMTHSTGVSSRLNRDMSGHFGDASYALEELVAELTAAMVGARRGFPVSMQENNAQYLSSWLSCLKEKPEAILTILGHVSKAALMIEEALGMQDKQEEVVVDVPKKQLEDVGPVRMEVYSEKCVVLRGTTSTMAARLRELGGKYNARLRGGAGWVFSKQKMTDDILRELIMGN